MRKITNEELGRPTAGEFAAMEKMPVTVVLDNVRSLQNVGAFFRTGDAFAVEHIALCGITAVPPNRDIHKTALGAELYARGARRLSYARELVVTLAGCGVNLACGFLIALAARRLSWEGGFLFAGAHFLLAAFNLLPIPPLDGSRALTLLVSFFFGPAAGDAAAAVAGLLLALSRVCAGTYIAAETGGGVLFLLASLALSFGLFRQVRLAKRERKV